MSRRLVWVHQNYVHHTQAGNGRASFLLRALTDAGWQVDLITGTHSYFGDSTDEGVTIEHDGALCIHRVPSHVGAKRTQYIEFSKNAIACARTLPRPDVIFASTPPLPQIAPSLILSAWWRRPVVLEVRDLWPAFLLEGGMLHTGLLVTALRCLEATALHHCDEAVLVGPAYQPYIEGMGVAPSRITIAPTGAVLPSLPADAGASWRAAHGLTNKVIALYAGSFNEAYDLDLLLHAAGQCEHKNIVWVLAGNGRGQSEVKHAAQQHAQIIDLGSLPRNEIEPVLAAADIGLLPHADWPLLSITISGKMFEYMAFGLAVVCLRDGTMGEIVRNARCGVVLDEATSQTLAEAVEKLADSTERVVMGIRGRQWVADHVEANAMAIKIQKAVERCRQGPQRRRLICAATRGVFDGLRNRSERVLNKDIRPQTQVLAKRTLSAWLSRSEEA